MGLIDLFFPKKCLSCNKEGSYFCSECVKKIKEVKQICPVCEKSSPFGQTHPLCLGKYSPDGLISFFLYDGIIRNAIHKLKYKLVTDLEKELWKIIENSLEKRGEELMVINKFLTENNVLVLPIPLYWRKENTRGFNQSLLLAKRLSIRYCLPLLGNIVVRTKNVVSQTKLTQKEREKNVKGIFEIRSENLLSKYNGVLIIDDVWTTGATLKEAVKTLKSAGVKQVWGITIAR